MASGIPHTDTARLLRSIAAAGEELANGQRGARERLLALSTALTASLELPSEFMTRLGWAEPAKYFTVRLAVELKWFDVLSERERPWTSKELAARSGADVKLVSRCLKHLAAMHVVDEATADGYAANALTVALTKPEFRDSVVFLHDIVSPSFAKMPDYFKKTNYRNPTSIADGPFQYAHETAEPFFPWLQQRPPYPGCFNNFMSGYHKGKASWLDPESYPFQERLVSGFNPGDGFLLVDVGGGLGHDLSELRAKQKNVPGKLVLQDQPSVIAEVPASNVEFESMAHDFFTTQPVKRARAYYLHSVLHDWDDESSRKILSQIIPAMKKGYSKILICELVMPDVGAPWGTTSLDLTMMSTVAVKERTEKEWRELLGSAGLKVSHISSYGSGTESLIEAELA